MSSAIKNKSDGWGDAVTVAEMCCKWSKNDVASKGTEGLILHFADRASRYNFW